MGPIPLNPLGFGSTMSGGNAQLNGGPATDPIGKFLYNHDPTQVRVLRAARASSHPGGMLARRNAC